MQGFLPLSFGHSRKWRRGVGIDSTSPSPPFTSHCVARAYTHMHAHTHGFNQRKSCGEENDNNPTFYDCARALVSVAADRERGNKDMCSVVTQGKERENRSVRYLPLFPHGFSLYVRTCVLLCGGKNCTNPAEAVASPFSSSFPSSPTHFCFPHFPSSYI